MIIFGGLEAGRMVQELQDKGMCCTIEMPKDETRKSLMIKLGNVALNDGGEIMKRRTYLS